MSTRPNRKVIKYKRQYLITIEGQTDTNMPDDKPFGLETAEHILTSIVTGLDRQWKSRSVTMETVE